MAPRQCVDDTKRADITSCQVTTTQEDEQGGRVSAVTCDDAAQPPSFRAFAGVLRNCSTGRLRVARWRGSRDGAR